MTKILKNAAFLGLLLLVGANAGGCSGSADETPPPADAGTNDLDAGTNNPDAGTHECAPLPCRMDCGPQGLKVDEHGCNVCECAAPIACQQRSECPEGSVCDLVNFCDPPPGCNGRDGCPAVCYGRCVVDRTPPPPPPPSACGDGQPVVCDMIIDCLPGLAAFARNGCWVCLDPKDCARPCETNLQCGDNEACVERTFDPCAGIDPSGPQCGAPVWLYKVCEPAGCGCTKEFMPVCGVDGRTYDNACLAACARTPVASQGACGGTACLCTEEFAPVCGSDGQTYPNACYAQCANVTYTTGECSSSGGGCAIQCLVADPVCGANGVTYGCGEPEASCNGTTVRHVGPCGGPCTGAQNCSTTEKCVGYVPPPPGTITPVPPGECLPVDYCALAADCAGLAGPAVTCVGDWACERNRCVFKCGN